MNPAHSSAIESNGRMGGVKRPILYCAVSFSAGIALTRFFGVPVPQFALLSLALMVSCALLFKKNVLSHVLLYIALVSFGAAYCQDRYTLPKDHVSGFAQEKPCQVTIKGTVADDPEIKKALFGKNNTVFTLNSAMLIMGDDVRRVTGRVRVSVYSGDAPGVISFGDEIAAKGFLSRPKGLANPGLFDYRDYLKIRGIYAVLNVSDTGSVRVISRGIAPRFLLASHRLRERIAGAIDARVDRPYRAFLKAILVGEKSGLDSEVLDDFIKTGTVHVIAISGLNIALVASILIFILKFAGIKKKPALAVASVALVFYCFTAGANPPVVRATVMFVIASIGYVIDREADILNSLGIAAFLILLWNPGELFDPSFQLSFASIAGIVLLAPKIESLLPARRNYVVKSIALSLAAMVSVAPIVARYFNIFSPSALVANIIIVPALFAVTVVSFAYLAFYFASLGAAASCMAAALSFLTGATFQLNHIFSAMPFSYIRIPAPSPPFIAVYYAFMLLLLFSRRKKEIVVALLFLANIVLWKDCLARPDKDLRMTFIDVGNGDSILVEFPGSKTMLVDAGYGGVEGISDMGRYVVGSCLWNKGIRRLDAVVTTHFHQDHAGGMLYILKNFGVGCAMDSDLPDGSGTRLYDDYRRILSQKSIRRLAIYERDEITGFGDARIFILNPPEGRTSSDSNEGSTVMKIEYGSFSALLCSDVSGKGLENILKYSGFLKSELLKVPHHGGSVGQEALTKIFFKEASPQILIISSSPSFSSRDGARADIYSGCTVYNTKDSGAIEVSTDGKGFTVRPFLHKN